jgi:hypothetical protein
MQDTVSSKVRLSRTGLRISARINVARESKTGPGETQAEHVRVGHEQLRPSARVESGSEGLDETAQHSGVTCDRHNQT